MSSATQSLSVEELLGRLSTLQHLRGTAEALPSVVRNPSLRLRDFLSWSHKYLIEPCSSSSHLRHAVADDGSQLSSCKEVVTLDDTLERHLRSLVDGGGGALLRSACSDAVLLEVVTDTIQATHAASRLFELWENATRARLNAMIKSGGGPASSLSDLITNLMERRGEEPAAFLSLAYIPLGQSRGGGVALASLLDAGSSTITVLSLSHMCISNELLTITLLPTLRALGRLQVLDLSTNLLSDAAISPIEESLTTYEKRSQSDVAWFKSILDIRLEGNAFVTREGCARLATTIASRHQIKGTPSHQRVLVVEGIGMEAFITGTALSRIPPSLFTPPSSTNPTLLVGSSFASVVAVAAAVGISQRLVDGFFFEVASSVFGRQVHGYSHTDSLLSASRWMRSWYTGGHFYSAEGLQLCLDNLFGKELLSKPFLGFPETVGCKARVMLVCADLDSGLQYVFRSYAATEQEERTSTPCALREVGNGTATVRDALTACCAIPGLFAPHQSVSGGCTRRLADMMQSALPAAVEEGLRMVSTLSDLCLRVVTPERQPRTDPGSKTIKWLDWKQLPTSRVSPLVVEVISHLCRGAHSRDATVAANMAGMSYLTSFLETPGASPSSRMWLPVTYKLPAEVEVRNTHARASVAHLLHTPTFTSLRVLPVIAAHITVPNPLAVDESDSQRLADTEVQCTPDIFADFFM